jgi:hypothetical protein
MRRIKLAFIAISLALMQACGGGGGGDGGPAVPANSFPLQTGYRALISSGSSQNLAISGDCSGSASITSSPASDATFEGVAGFSASTTQTINFSNCTPASTAATVTSYYDASFTPLGSDSAGIEYSAFETRPPVLPASVKVGDTAQYATLTVYSDSTKSTVTGRRVLSYVIEADTASTAIANLITTASNAANQPIFTQQSRYRMAADGTLSLLSIDIQFSTTSTLHLVLTKT